MLLRAIQRLDRGRMPANLIGLKPGDEVELSRELVVKAFATKHTIPSLGYLVWERRKKLKPEYQRPDRRPDPRPAALRSRGLGRDPAAQGRLPGRYRAAGLDAFRRSTRPRS